jgi:hypothetical protein
MASYDKELKTLKQARAQCIRRVEHLRDAGADLDDDERDRRFKAIVEQHHLATRRVLSKAERDIKLARARNDKARLEVAEQLKDLCEKERALVSGENLDPYGVNQPEEET